MKKRLDTRLIHNFFMGLSDREKMYLTHHVEVYNSINALIKKHDLSKEKVVELFMIEDFNDEQYQEFVSGGGKYSINTIACLNCAVKELNEPQPSHDR